MAVPRCRYFGKCGGCSFQHIDYSSQLEEKKKTLQKATGFEEIAVVHGSEYFYRNRMDFVFFDSGVGLRKKKDWKTIIDIDNCVIAEPKINAILSEAKNFFKSEDAFDVKKHSGTFRYIVVRVTDIDSCASFVLNSKSPRLKQAIEKIKEYSKTCTAQNIVIAYVPPNTDVSVSADFFAVKGSVMLYTTLIGRRFCFSSQGFFQNNNLMAEKMQEYVNNILKNYETKDAELLDLYGGVGTFGIINSGLFSSSTIVESVKECIDCAEKNIEENGIKNTKAVLLDAKQLKKLEFKKRLFVVTDPPRSGMHPKTIEQLNALKPEAIIYVSCNIGQLAKDIPKFKDYSVKSAALMDLFPQTPHSEAVVELLRK